MNKVSVLVEGYAREWRSSGWEASSSAVLIQTDKVKILCDPGTNAELLFAALTKKHLTANSIDWVFLSHTAIEYCYATACFPKAKVITGRSFYDKDKQDLHSGEIPGTNLKILATPGHSTDHCSLVIPTSRGIYVVAGGAFWWAKDEEQETDRFSLVNHKDVIAIDEKAAKESRKKILEIADYIIPGYGKMFKT